MKQLSVVVFLIVLISCKEDPDQTHSSLQRQIALCPPVTDDKEWYLSDNKAPILEGLDVLNFPISTETDLAQAYFNQGLIWLYAFNHYEAIR